MTLTKRILLVAISLSVWANAEEPCKPLKNFQGAGNLSQAMARNDVHVVDFLFTDDSFKCDNIFQRNAVSDKERAEAKEQMKNLADSATHASGNSWGGCKTEIIKALVGHDVQFSPENFAELGEYGCKDAITAVAPQFKGQNEKIISALKKFAEDFPNKFNVGSNGVRVPKASEDLVYGLGLFSVFAENLCKNKKVGCELQKTYDGLIKSVEQEDANRKRTAQWIKTPDHTAKSACDTQSQLDEKQKLLNHEKQVVKESGVGDAEVLHNLGTEVVNLKDQMEKLKSEYKKRSGKTLDLKKECKN